MADISISNAMRGILSGLSKTTENMTLTQKRLATGKKVSSPIDNPSAYFTAKSLTNRAEDLSALKDSIVKSVSTVQTAINGLKGIESVLKQMKGLAESAKASSTVSERTSYSDQYDALRSQLDTIASDSSFDGINLIKASADSLTVKFNETSTSSLTITGIASDSAGLSVTAANDWDNATVATGTTNITADIALIDAALKEVRTSATTLGSNAALLKTRLDFTTDMIEGLEAGAGSLVNADMNAESAALLALQTRQQLSVTALSMSNQNEQSILKLFG